MVAEVKRSSFSQKRRCRTPKHGDVRLGPASLEGPTLWVDHDLSVCQVDQPALLLLAEEAPDGGFDALLLGLLVEGVLAAGHAAQRAGLRFQRRPQPEDTAQTSARGANTPHPPRVDTYPLASLCEEAGSVCVIRTVRGVGGGEVSHLMVALSSRPSSSTAAICRTRGGGGGVTA